MGFSSKESVAEMRELTQALRNKQNGEARLQQLLDGMNALCDQDTEFYIWDKDSTNSMDGVLQRVHSFRTEADARKYIEIDKEARELHNVLYGCKSYYPLSYSIGTAAEYRAAVKTAAAQAERKQREAFKAYVIKQNEKDTEEIKALKAFRAVYHQFNGKVINKRFTDAIDAAVKKYDFFVSSGEASWAPFLTLLKFYDINGESRLYFRDKVWRKGGPASMERLRRNCCKNTLTHAATKSRSAQQHKRRSLRMYGAPKRLFVNWTNSGQATARSCAAGPGYM